ncbi:MAG TPA: hypothetical protein VND65_07745, partial [Candidatus Binatia bacterium]|nr:hypothetical protein [Candidatus Binatia bacterium]
MTRFNPAANTPGLIFANWKSEPVLAVWPNYYGHLSCQGGPMKKKRVTSEPRPRLSSSSKGAAQDFPVVGIGAS